MSCVLWKRRLDSADWRMLDVDDLPNSGFRSVYCFSQSDAQSIQNLGAYQGYKGTVHSPTLFIDCDTAEASDATKSRFLDLGIAFEQYTTGNRGHHFHVERQAEASHMLPALDKQWVETNCPGADLSIYHHVAMYRQTGAIHQKTGKRKELVYRSFGNPLVLSGRPEATPSAPTSGGYTEMKSVFDDKYLRSITVPLSKGERHEQGIKIALGLMRLGQPEEFAWWYVFNVSLMSEVPLEPKEIDRLIDWAFHKSMQSEGRE